MVDLQECDSVAYFWFCWKCEKVVAGDHCGMLMHAILGYDTWFQVAIIVHLSDLFSSLLF